MPDPAIAHVRSADADEWLKHGLLDHLQSVGDLAGAFATPLGANCWASLAGLWHDLGKYQPAFQEYIRSASGMEAHIETAPGRVKHAIAGAIQAEKSLGPYGKLIAYLIAGHHAGLPDWYPEGNGAALSQELRDERATLDASLAAGIPDEILSPPISLAKPPIRKADELHLWLRMLFSCLVDADFLDTEAFMDEGRAGMRGGHAEIATLRAARPICSRVTSAAPYRRPAQYSGRRLWWASATMVIVPLSWR